MFRVAMRRMRRHERRALLVRSIVGADRNRLVRVAGIGELAFGLPFVTRWGAFTRRTRLALRVRFTRRLRFARHGFLTAGRSVGARSSRIETLGDGDRHFLAEQLF